jgi:hypothetical protein
VAVKCSPFGPKPAFFLATGLPAVGNLLFFYVAGSVNTKQATYTASTGLSANTNPLILNALGEPSTEIWFTEGLAYKVVYAPVGDTDPPSSPIWTIDNLRGINDTTSSQDQWVASGVTPTFVSAVSFTLPGDQTNAFHAGRRVKTTNSGGTIYGTIITSVFGALTTVTVVNDSGALDSGLSAVSLGLLTARDMSIPNFVEWLPIDGAPAAGDYLLTSDTSTGTLKRALISLIGPKAFVGSNTRNLGGVTADVPYTGVGFQGSSIEIFSCVGASLIVCSGIDDGTNHRSIATDSLGAAGMSVSHSIVLQDNATNGQIGFIKSFDADGFTITWTKVGATGGTGSFTYKVNR